MPRRKELPKYERPVSKDTYHTFGLQGLPPRQFTVVVRRILKGQNRLVTCRGNGREVTANSLG
ncbi:hypothetical protein GF356_00055 [candidate division GN15 bacterium]|nr:hypothetical protein [candidate division GN15 bacterium]